MNKIVKDFMMSCNVLDTESTGLDPFEAEICELGVCKFDGTNFNKADVLFGTTEPIPFLASAKNNISRNMLKGLPTFTDEVDTARSLLDTENYSFFVAHNVNYDKRILTSNFKRAGLNNNQFARHSRWICTYRLAKQLFPLNEENPDMSYALSYLRYAFELDVEDGVAVHRAGDDAFVCAKLLEHIAGYVLETYADSITTGEELGELIYELSSAPIIYDTLSFGKHKGERIKDIATKNPKYLMWCLENMDNLKPEDINFDEDLYTSIFQALDEAV